MHQHFDRVDAAVREAACDEKTPLVALGIRHLQDAYRDVSTFPDLLLPTITGDLAPEAIHQCACNIVEQELQAREYATAVLRYSGPVISVPAHRMPDHAPIVATLRH